MRNTTVFIKKENGFTLVELLATIVILGIVISIVVFSVSNIIKHTKNNSYQVTINNVETAASNYVTEKLSSSDWKEGSGNSSFLYQCVTVQKLIDMGYFKGDIVDSYVTDESKVQVDDYIYLEKDIYSKKITKSVLIYDGVDSAYDSVCDLESGRINFIIEPTGWKMEKTITIKYNIRNLVDSSEVNGYRYEYSFVADGQTISSGSGRFINYQKQDFITVVKNGTLYAKIYNQNGEEIGSNNLVVTNVDRGLPTVEISSTNVLANEQSVTLKMSDEQSGVAEYYFGKTNPSENDDKVEWIRIKNTKEKELITTVKNSGTWYLGVKDEAGNIGYSSIKLYKISFSILENATVSSDYTLALAENKMPFPTVTPASYYSFIGWYDNSSYSGNMIDINNYIPTADTTLYGKVVENTLIGGKVQIDGTPMYGQTLLVNIVEDTSPKPDKYTYQWYYQAANSDEKKLISGATSNSLTIQYKMFNKNDFMDALISVKVTAIKNNYRDTILWDDADNVVQKRPIVVSANSAEKKFDNNPLTNSICTATNLAFEHTAECEMTADSTITNVGSVDNKINKVSIYNNLKESLVNEYYDITLENGVLKVTKADATVTLKEKTATYTGDIIVANTATSSSGAGASYTYYTDSNCSIKTTYSVGAAFSGGAPKDAGNYYVIATVASTSNYNSAQSGCTKHTINSKSLTVNWTNTELTYTGDSLKPSASVNTGVTGETMTLTVSGEQINVGTHEATASCSSVSGGRSKCSNYNLTNNTSNFEIKPKSVSVTWTNTELTYTGDSLKPSASVSTGVTGETMTLTVSGEQKKPGTHEATASCSSVSGGNKSCNNYSLTNAKKQFTIINPSVMVTYNANGGSGSMESTTCTKGENCTLSKNSFSWQCHKPVSWNTKADGTGTSYSDGGTIIVSADTTLYAIWKEKHNWTAVGSTLLNFGASKFTCGHYHTTAYAWYCRDCQMSVAYYNLNVEDTGASLLCPCSYWTGQGYAIFDDAALKPSGKNYLDRGLLNQHFGVSSDLTFGILSSFKDSVQERCKDHKYQLIFDANGGSVSDTSKTISYRSAVGDLPTPTRSEYKFISWNTKADGSGTTYTKDTEAPNDNVTLYAQWQKLEVYWVSFNANGGTAAPASQKKLEGIPLTLPSSKPIRSGYTFLSWNTKADGSGKKYLSGGTYNSDEAVTLYAQWKASSTGGGGGGNIKDPVTEQIK